MDLDISFYFYAIYVQPPRIFFVDRTSETTPAVEILDDLETTAYYVDKFHPVKFLRDPLSGLF